MWYESVKMCVRPSVRPKEWMEKRTRLIDNFHHLLTFYLTGILNADCVSPSIRPCQSEMDKDGNLKMRCVFLTFSNFLDPKGGKFVLRKKK